MVGVAQWPKRDGVWPISGQTDIELVKFRQPFGQPGRQRFSLGHTVKNKVYVFMNHDLLDLGFRKIGPHIDARFDTNIAVVTILEPQVYAGGLAY